MKLTLQTENQKTYLTEIQEPVQLYRKPHDIEIYSYDSGDWRYGGAGYRSGRRRSAAALNPMPEVYRLEPDHVTLLNCDCQRLWWELNPELSARTQSTLLDNGLAFCNHGTGFPYRHNCLTGEHPELKDPAFDAPRDCGGALHKGIEQDGYLMIESILTTKPIPAGRDVIDKPWLWYWMTSVRPDGGINIVRRTSLTGALVPVKIPLITNQPVKIRLDFLDKLPIGTATSPDYLG